MIITREALAIEVDTSLPAQRVIRVLEQVTEWRGKPKRIRLDNGPEFISTALGIWCEDKGITLQFIQPGKPTQNAYIERFNGSFRRDVLDAYLFEDINQIRRLVEEWMEDYNNHRPQDALNGRSPMDLWKTPEEFPTNPQGISLQLQTQKSLIDERLNWGSLQCRVKGIGRLTIYDAAQRIGANINIEPQKVYLHQGTRMGAQRHFSKTLTVDSIDRKEFKDFRDMSCAAIEDIMCIYKDEFLLRPMVARFTGGKSKC